MSSEQLSAEPITDGVVVELYTSQGCSSCPPADAVFDELANSGLNVVPLAFHVDYWDYLGWKDTFGSPVFSARQFAYSNVRGEKQVFTPQVMINGQFSFSGTDARGIRAGIEAAQRDQRTVSLDIRDMGDVMEVNMQAVNGGPGNTDIWLAYTQPNVSVAIERGENAGRTVEYTHIVRQLQRIGEWQGRMGTRLIIPKQDGFHAVLFLQEERSGPIRYGAKLQ